MRFARSSVQWRICCCGKMLSALGWCLEVRPCLVSGPLIYMKHPCGGRSMLLMKMKVDLLLADYCVTRSHITFISGHVC